MSIGSNVAIAFIVLAAKVGAAEFEPPFEAARISDVYGPRFQVETSTGVKATSPHGGIDLADSSGISIHSIERSSITEIKFDPRGVRGKGWYITAQSVSDPRRVWRYQHLFWKHSNGSETAGSGRFRVFPSTVPGRNATIVFYTDINRNVPVKAFTVEPASDTFVVPIIPGTHTISVPVVGIIAEGERIGPVGRSGSATGNHLHLSLFVNGRGPSRRA